MSAAEQQQLVDFLNNGGDLYIEGTNVADDHTGTALWNLLGADFIGAGPLHGDVGSMQGNDDTFVSGKHFGYANNTDADIYSNRLNPGSGTLLMSSTDPTYGRVVARENGDSRTIVSSVIFGALADSDALSTKRNTMLLYFNYLSNKTAPTIHSSDDAIELGLTAPGNAISDTLYIQNVGRNQLDISSISLTGDAFELTAPATANLGFGESIALVISYPAAASGEFSGTIDIISNDVVNTVLSIPLTASSYYPPTLQTPTELMGYAAPGETATATFELSNIGELPLNYWLDVRPVTRGSGGPDGFGYSWTDSNEPDGPEYVWNDIATTGTLLDLAGSNSFIEIDLPWGFPFYGEVQQQIKLASNGYLTFHEDGTDRTNDPIPNVVYPNNSIFPFWDNMSADFGSLYYLDDPAENRVIIQYTNWTLSSGYGDYTFQIHLYSNGTIYFYYNHMEGTLTSATIGIENQDGLDGLQIAYNQPYMEDGLAVKISSGLDWLLLDAYTGSISPGQTNTVLATFDASSLDAGLYNAQIIAHSNDPVQPSIIIPVTLEVAAVSAGEAPQASRIVLRNFPNPFNPTTTIQFSIPQDAGASEAQLQIFNSRGQIIRTEQMPLNAEQTMQSYTWDGTDANRAPMASGLYFYRIKAGDFTASKKMLLMK